MFISKGEGITTLLWLEFKQILSQVINIPNHTN